MLTLCVQVEEVQSVYLSLLESYIFAVRENPAKVMGAQLNLLTDLR
jgi:hypothetical protein